MPVKIRPIRPPASAAVLTLVSAAVAMTSGTAAAQVTEIQYRRPLPYAVELPPPEARGCYYHRGRRYCGAYCYWEVNGKRYCQRRERDAHSQAPIVEEYFDGPTMK